MAENTIAGDDDQPLVMELKFYATSFGGCFFTAVLTKSRLGARPTPSGKIPVSHRPVCKSPPLEIEVLLVFWLMSG
jgi:hypothetical protein